MRIRVARKVYNPVVEAGQGAYYGNLVNPISESMGDPPYRIVFAINPLKSGEIDKVIALLMEAVERMGGIKGGDLK